MSFQLLWPPFLKLFRLIIQFFTCQFITVVVVTYFIVYSTLLVFSEPKTFSEKISPTMSFELQANEKLIIEDDDDRSQQQYRYEKECYQILKTKYCVSNVIIPLNPTQENKNNLIINCVKDCEIELNSTKYKPQNTFIYGDNVKLTISYLKTTQFLADISQGRILIEDLAFDQAKINLGKGDLVIQTAEDVTLTSITKEKYLCITSPKVFKNDQITQIGNIQEIMQARDETKGEICTKVFPFEQRNHNKMISEIKHPIFDDIQNTQVMQFEETRCNYIEQIHLLGAHSDFSTAQLKKLLISTSEGNTYINVLKKERKMGNLLQNNQLESSTKLNFTDESASKLKQTIESISKSGRSQDILLLNFRNNYQKTTSTFIILFNPITLFSTPMTVSLFSFGTLSNKQEQQDLNLIPNICPYIFSGDYLEKTDDVNNSESILDQRKNMFSDLIKQFFYDNDIKVFQFFHYEEYNKIAFPKLETFPNQDESYKRVKILYISIIPFLFFGLLLLYKALQWMTFYLKEAAQQRKQKDREKIIFALLQRENDKNNVEQKQLSDYVNGKIDKKLKQNNSKQFVKIEKNEQEKEPLLPQSEKKKNNSQQKELSNFENDQIEKKEQEGNPNQAQIQKNEQEKKSLLSQSENEKNKLQQKELNNFENDQIEKKEQESNPNQAQIQQNEQEKKLQQSEEKQTEEKNIYYFVNVSQLTLYTAQYLYKSVMNWFEFKKLNSFEVFCKILFDDKKKKKNFFQSLIIYMGINSNQDQNSPVERIQQKEIQEKCNDDLESGKDALVQRKTTQNEGEQKQATEPVKLNLEVKEVNSDVFKEVYQVFCYIYNMNEQYIFSETNVAILAKYEHIIQFDKNNQTKKIINQNVEKRFVMNKLILYDLFNLIQYSLIENRQAKEDDSDLNFFRKRCKKLKKAWTNITEYVTKCCKNKNKVQTEEKQVTQQELLIIIKKNINRKYKKYIRNQYGFLHQVYKFIAAILVPVAFFSPTIIFVWVFSEENAKYIYNLKRIYNDHDSYVNFMSQAYEKFSDVIFWHAVSLVFIFITLLVFDVLTTFSNQTKNTQRIYFEEIKGWRKFQKKIRSLQDIIGWISTILLVTHMIVQVAYIYIALIIIVVGSIVFSKVELPFLIFFSFLITAIIQLSHSFYKNYEEGRKRFQEIFKNNYLNKVAKYQLKKNQPQTGEAKKKENSHTQNSLEKESEQKQEIDYRLTDLDHQFEQFDLVDDSRDTKIQFDEIKTYFKRIEMDLNDIQMNQIVAKLINPESSQFEFNPGQQIDFEKFKSLIKIFINQKVDMGLIRMGVSYQVLLRSIFKITTLSIFAGFFIYMIFVSFIVGEQDIDILSSNGIISAGGIISVIMLREDKSQVLNNEKLVEQSALDVERIVHSNNFQNEKTQGKTQDSNSQQKIQVKQSAV